MIEELAPAKINLALHVRARRGDGYHDIETLFAFLRDGDRIGIAPAGAPSLTLSGPFGAALAGEGEGDNLVTRAADRFAHEFGGGPWAIALEKNLPIASGIGGGSADAAATLRALARAAGTRPDPRRLFAIAAELGADVPACLLGVSAIGRGKGEALTPIVGLGAVPVLLVNPGVAVSTASVFHAWDGIDRGGIAEGALLDRAHAGRNDLEAPARAIAPVIGEVLALLTAQPGVTLSRMSGSGATCFALFDSTAACAAAHAAIAADAPGWWCLASTLA